VLGGCPEVPFGVSAAPATPLRSSSSTPAQEATARNPQHARCRQAALRRRCACRSRHGDGNQRQDKDERPARKVLHAADHGSSGLLISLAPPLGALSDRGVPCAEAVLRCPTSGTTCGQRNDCRGDTATIGPDGVASSEATTPPGSL
jgi:hypothetical protein